MSPKGKLLSENGSFKMDAQRLLYCYFIIPNIVNRQERMCRRKTFQNKKRFVFHS